MTTGLSLHDLSDSGLLSGITATFESGRVHGIIGPNGAGKSTLITALAGLRHTTGDILVDGIDPRRLPPRKRARLISYLPQITDVHSDVTGRDIVRMSRYARLSRFGSLTATDEAACASALQLTGAYAWADRPYLSTSGGEQQLTQLARTIAQGAQIMLLDEPNSALDLAHELEVLTLIRQWVTEHEGTVIVVLHDLSLAARFCDTVSLLVDGSLVGTGSPEAVLTPQAIAQAYRVEVDVSYSPLTDSLQITPVSPLHRPTQLSTAA